MSTTFDTAEFLDRVYFQVGVEQTEAEKGVYRDELAIIAEDAMVELATSICGNYEQGRAGDPSLRTLFETIWRFPIVATGYASILDDATKYDEAGAATTRNLMLGTIRAVYHVGTDAVRTKATKLRSSDDLDKPQRILGLVYWHERDSRIETIDKVGRNRFNGNNLDGYLEVHGCFIPTITDFPNRQQLQKPLVDVMLRFARAKRDDRLAAALEKERAA